MSRDDSFSPPLVVVASSSPLWLTDHDLTAMVRGHPGGAIAEGESDVAPALDPSEQSKNTILCGGSLGSCVDEERSQLR